jgi:hypothetical protein
MAQRPQRPRLIYAEETGRSYLLHYEGQPARAIAKKFLTKEERRDIVKYFLEG